MAIWASFVDGPGRTTALRAVMECLGESDACEAMIARLASAARAARLSDERLVIIYDRCALALGAPHTGPVAGEVPASFARLARSINGIALDSGWRWSGLTEEGTIVNVAHGHDVVAPIQHHEDWIAYHPVVRTTHGEPALCVCDPLTGELGDPLSIELGFGATLLRLLAHQILGEE